MTTDSSVREQCVLACHSRTFRLLSDRTHSADTGGRAARLVRRRRCPAVHLSRKPACSATACALHRSAGCAPEKGDSGGRLPPLWLPRGCSWALPAHACMGACRRLLRASTSVSLDCVPRVLPLARPADRLAGIASSRATTSRCTSILRTCEGLPRSMQQGAGAAAPRAARCSACARGGTLRAGRQHAGQE